MPMFFYHILFVAMLLDKGVVFKCLNREKCYVFYPFQVTMTSLNNFISENNQSIN